MRRVCLLLLALLIGLADHAAAQTYSLAPAGYQTVLNNSGAPVSTACVWTYAAGTMTPIATYSDAAGTVNTNPIRTNTAGRFTAYLLPGTAYKFIYELPCAPPAHGTVLLLADPVVGTSGGTWVDLPYSAGNFTAVGGMTWTVPAANVSTYMYRLEGKQLTLAVHVLNTTLGGTAAQELRVALPPGLTIASQGTGPTWSTQDVIIAFFTSGTTYVSLYKYDVSSWTLGNVGQISATIVLRIV